VSGERARLFVALEVPAEVRRALAAWTREHTAGVQGLRPVAAESLHVTLCFLGSRPVAEVGEIAAACTEAVSGLPAAPLTVGRALWLPPRRARVLTVELGDQEGRLAAVQSAVAQALAEGGFYEPETRPFLAHVTVARVRRDGRPPRRGGESRDGRAPRDRAPRGELPAPASTRFTADRVTLFQSRLGGGPARYEALSSVELSQS